MLTRLFIASIRANLGRTALSVAGIALGVALGLAVHVINQSAISEMQQASRTLSGDADLALRGGRASIGGFDERILETFLNDERIAVASPVLEMSATPESFRQAIKFIGIDIFQAARLQPGFVGEMFDQNASANRYAVLEPNQLFLNRAARALLPTNTQGLPDSPIPPASLVVPVSLERKTLSIAGKIELPQFKEPLAVMDIAGAQALFNQVGYLSRIDLRLQPGVNIEQFRADLLPRLPPGLTLITPQQADEQSAAVSRAYRINLTVLSMVALFTGGFLVFSTQSLSVVRRRAQFALYRTLGVTRSELMRVLLAEGAILGAMGGALGCVLGLAIATIALKKFGADLGSGFFAGVTPEADWHMGVVVFFILLGIAAGGVGAWLPAQQAAFEAPARALKATDDAGDGAAQVPPLWIGLGLLLLGAVLLAVPAMGGIPWAAYASIASMLFGVIALAPTICARVLSMLPLSTSVIRQLAVRHIEKSPGPAAAAITGIVASFSLMIAMLIMVVSFRASLEDWLTGALTADVYVRMAGSLNAGEANTLNPSTGVALQALSGVEKVDFLRYRSILLKYDMPPVTLIARPLREDVLASLTLLNRVNTEAIVRSGLASVWITEAMVDLYGFKAGQIITVPIDGVARTLIVGGVWRDYARSNGAMTIDRDAYIAITGDTRINDAALKLRTDADKLGVISAIRLLRGGERLEIIDASEIRKLSLSAFDRSFAVTYALEIAAIFVGLAGISATFSAQAWSRRREFGMLRHLGMTRAEIKKLLSVEGALLGSIGAAIGLALGFAIALVLIFIVNRQSFHWSMELHIPWLVLVILSMVLIALTALSAIISGRFALSRLAVMAVKEDA